MLSNSNNSQTIRNKFDWRNYIVYIAFFVVFIFFALTQYQQGFLTIKNILNIMRQTSMISIMAISMVFVIGAGQIDLSVGAVTAVSALLTALTLSHTNSIGLGLLVGLGVGALIGVINGLLIIKTGIPAFLATLGMMGIARGFAMWVTDNAAVPILNNTFNFMFGIGDILGIPVLFIWTIVALIIGDILLRKTSYGKKVLATGGNEVAALGYLSRPEFV